MAIYEITAEKFKKVPETTFSTAGIKERADIQRMLRDQIEILIPDALVIAEEFGHWEDSKRRIDLLAIGKDASLIVIELKRTEDGGHMELQALRYAAMVSTMTFEKAIEIYDAYLKKNGSSIEPTQEILDFLGWDEALEDEFAQEVKIVLASQEFSKELTSTVIWLNKNGLDIRCIRMRPYLDGSRVLLDVQTVIPLPEAEDYQVKIREKQQKERISRASSKDYTKFIIQFPDHSSDPLPKRRAAYTLIKYLCDNGVNPDEIQNILSWRGNGLWRKAAGKLNADAFHSKLSQASESGGLAFEDRRWFYSDDELIYANGVTYALTKMWGRRTEEAMEDLIKAFPLPGVGFSPA